MIGNRENCEAEAAAPERFAKLLKSIRSSMKESDFFTYKWLVAGFNHPASNARFENKPDQHETDLFQKLFCNADVPLTTDDGLTITADERTLGTRRENLVGLSVEPDLTERAMEDAGIDFTPLS